MTDFNVTMQDLSKKRPVPSSATPTAFAHQVINTIVNAEPAPYEDGESLALSESDLRPTVRQTPVKEDLPA